MKFKNPLLTVSDMERSVKFYKEALGLRVIANFGANVTLTGGVCLQTKESWANFIEIDTNKISCSGNWGELYFEEDDFDAFAAHLSKLPDINYVHKVKEHDWGQRVLRFRDPDGHIIEVGENLKIVCKRFADLGMSEEKIAVRMDIPVNFVKKFLK